MSYAFDSRLGKQLYQLLPELYRTRDRTTRIGVGGGGESLARFLDAHGHLLDLIHATLEQQLRDALPESSQDWLLPYFAQLLAASIVSPESAGKHAEIAHAVEWRQRKGTLKCAEEIAEAVGQMEVELQEGWKRVAMTPRIGMPLMPAETWDDTLDLDMSRPTDAIRHPQLPGAMVDFRRASRAVEAASTNPAAKTSSFGGIRQSWRQTNVHGVPCFPGGFDDVSRRTVDLRTRDGANGHYHHRTLLAYAPPPPGLFPFEPIQLEWEKRKDSLYEHLIEEKEEAGVWLIRNKTGRIIEFVDVVVLSPARPYRVEGLNFRTKLSVENGSTLELHRVEAVEVQVDSFSTDEPVLIAEDCLFNELSVGSGTVKLDSCTILSKAYLYDVDAVDCIFMDITGTAISGVIQYSRIPFDAPISADEMTVEDATTKVPVFFGEKIKHDTRNTRHNNGAGVLRSDCSQDIYAGASDGGEMGYFHHGRKSKPVRLAGVFAFDSPDDGGYPLEDLVFEDGVVITEGKLKLRRSSVRDLTVETDDAELFPVLDAKDCLFDKLLVSGGLVHLEYCTVMDEVDCQQLQASDCIFAGTVLQTEDGESEYGCIRFSRIPSDLSGNAMSARVEYSSTNTIATPIFNRFSYCVWAIAIRVLVINPGDTAVIHAGTNRSVIKSLDAGDNWSLQNDDLRDFDVQTLAIDPSEPNVIYAGTDRGGVFKSENAGDSWSPQNHDLGDLNVQILAINPNEPNVIYAGTQRGGVFKSEDTGDGWLAQNAGLSDLDVQALAIDPSNPDVIYAGTNGGGVFKSANAGDSWSAHNTGLGDLDVQVLAIDPSNPDVIYAGTNGGGVFKSTNAGDSWSAYNAGLIDLVTDLNVQALTINPADPNVIYVGTDRAGIFKSLNAGGNWSAHNNGLSDLNVQVLAIDPTETNVIYAGTHHGGIFSSDDAGDNWVQRKAALGVKQSERRNPVFGEPGYGVLNPAAPDAIRFGAEDGGEMGAYHHKYYSLRAEAVLNKMREFLPVGIEPVLIQDTRLLHVPPEQTTTEESSGNGGES